MKNVFLIVLVAVCCGCSKPKPEVVSQEVMRQMYEEIKTPYKYGLVMTGIDADKMTDCPTIIRRDGKWYMYYFVFDGRGYETWVAESDNLLDWTTSGRVLSFSDEQDWDSNQKGGYIALPNTKWGGDYSLEQYDGKYWMSYFGSNTTGYENGLLSIGIAYTEGDPTQAHEWQRLEKPVLTPVDEDASWWDNVKLYKNSIIRDPERLTGYDFLMYYNAKGDSISAGESSAERIGLAVSNDMVNWKRYGTEPLLEHGKKGITGDAYLQKIGDVWVMFYFGVSWKGRPKSAWNSFACSYDLIHWTDWEGEELIKPTEDFESRHAHKSCVIKYNDVVYHFYCSVETDRRCRGIALATSKDLGKSSMTYPSCPD